MIANTADFFDALLAAGVDVTRTFAGGLSVRGPTLAVRALTPQIRQRRSELLAHLAALDRAAIARVNALRADRKPIPALHPTTTAAMRGKDNAR
jgi:hypothetical protein